MAEIIAEPSALSKIIPVSFKINDTDSVTTTRLATKKQFNTTDTDAWLSFGLDGIETTDGEFDLTLINVDENPSSIFHHTSIAFSGIPFHYKLDAGEDLTKNEIRHAGRWIGQVIIRLANGDTTTRQFDFAIAGHLLDGKEARVILIEDYNALMATITASKTELEGYNIDYSALLADINAAEALREQAEIDREAALDALIASGTVDLKVAEKYQELETLNSTEMVSMRQQLEQKADWINVKSLGALGDGLTDCSALINASIVDGTTLFIPKGVFLADILVAVPRVTICGEGTIKGSVKVDLPVVDNIQPDARFEIRDVDFEKNVNVWAIRLANARIGSIKNVTTSDAFTYPVYYDEASTYSQRTAKIRITDSFLFGDYGIYLKESLAAFGAADIQVHNTQFLNKVSNIHLEHVDGFIESGNTLFMTGYGQQSTVKKHNVYADFINWGKFGSGSNYFEAGLESIFITRFQNTVISGLSIAWPGQRVQSDAIKLTNGGISGDYIGVSIVSNITILFPTKHGIETDANITDLLIDNIVVRGAGSGSYYYGVPALTGTCYGVLIPAFSVDKFVMISNVMSPLNLCSITNRAVAKNIMDSSGFYDISATEDFTATGARIIPSKKGVKVFNLSNTVATNVTSISEAFYQIGSEITLIAYNSNTTLVHDVAEIALTGKVNLLMQAYTAYKFMWTGSIWIQV